MINIGIIGVGETVGIAHFHQKGILSDGRARVSAVYDVNRENALAFVKANKIDCIVANDIEEFWDNVDGVCICSPNFTHYSYTMEAIKRNKHFLVEKPTALNVSEAKKMAEALGDKNLVNMVAFIYRHINVINEAKKLIENKFTQLYTYTAYYGGKRLANPNVPLEWRFIRDLSGTGAICDFASHSVDTANYMAGLEFSSVSGITNTFIKQRMGRDNVMESVENEDACVFIAKDKSGCLASFTVSRVGMDEMTINITGDGGMIAFSLRNPEKILYWEKEISGAYTGEMKEIPVEEEIFFEDWFKKELTAFISAILGENEDYPSLEQGHAIMKFLDFVEISDKQNKKLDI